MEIIIKISQFLLSLSVLVFIHELGHFTFAKLFKTRVEKFYLFFNPWFSLFKFKRGETTYGIGWLPIGGYVKIAGMIDESFDREQMKKPPKPWEFRSKTISQRFLIMFGGVLFNFVFAWFIYSFMLVSWGEKYLPVDSLKDGVWCIHEKAVELGFENGDKIVSVNGKKYEKLIDLSQDIIFGGDIKINRYGKDTTITLASSDISDLIKSEQGLLFYPRVPMVVGSVPDSSLNSDKGLAMGDMIIAVNNQKISYFDQFAGAISDYKGRSVMLTVIRDNSQKRINVAVSDKGLIEIIPAFFSMDELEKFDIYKFKTIEYGFFAAFPAGIVKAKETLGKYIKQFKLIFQVEGAYKGMGGFISMTKIFPPAWDWKAFWDLTALLSVILGFMNFLPIPALDGGHIMFLLYEVFAGRKPSEKFLEKAQLIGMSILFALLIFANGNDLVKVIGG